MSLFAERFVDEASNLFELGIGRLLRGAWELGSEQRGFQIFNGGSGVERWSPLQFVTEPASEPRGRLGEREMTGRDAFGIGTQGLDERGVRISPGRCFGESFLLRGRQVFRYLPPRLAAH